MSEGHAEMGKTMKSKKKILDLEHGETLPVLLMLPTIIVVLVVMIIPLIYGLVISTFDYNVGSRLNGDSFVGLSNYIKLCKDPLVLKSLVNTLIFTVSAIAGEFAFGTLLAVFLLKLGKKTEKIMRGIFSMPLLISPIIVGLIWRYVYDPQSGLIYWLLGYLGIGVNQFPGVSGMSTALLSAVIAHWWEITPFVLIIVSSGLVSIDTSLYEAAKMDGANEWKQFCHISLPLLKKVYMVIMIISGVDTFKVFDIIYSLTQGGPANSTLSMSIYAYKVAFEQYQMGYAMAIAIFSMVVALILFGIPFMKSQNNKEGRC